jgi:type IV pilus assembly protein PilN
MSDINLLPWREERVFHKNNIFYLLAGISGVVMVGFMLIINFYIKFLAQQQNGNISFLNKEITVYQAKIKEINAIKERRETTLSRAEVINSLQAKRASVIKILEGIVRSLPDGVVFQQMAIKDNNLLITASSESTTRVSLFMRNLEGLPIFSNPKLQEIKAPKNQSADSSISFVLQIQVEE